jgi:hypothetical protein
MTRFPAKVPEGFTPDANPLGKRRVFNTGVIAAQPDDSRQFVSAPRSRRQCGLPQAPRWVRFAIFQFRLLAPRLKPFVAPMQKAVMMIDSSLKFELC